MTRSDREADRQVQRDARRDARRDRFAAAVSLYRTRRFTLDRKGRPSLPPSGAFIARGVGVCPKTVQRWAQGATGGQGTPWKDAVAAIDAEIDQIWEQYFAHVLAKKVAKSPKYWL